MRLLVLFLTFVVFALPAQAQQQFYVKKKLQTNVEEYAPPPVMPTVKDPSTLEQDEDPLAILRGEPAPDYGVVLDESQPAGPQIANAYFNNCVRAEHPSFTQKGKEMMCACTAAAMQEELTEEELLVIGENSPSGQAARDKMMIHVYVPCIRYPTHDLVYTRCMQDEVVAAQLRNHQTVCTCMADGMAEYIEGNAQEYMVSSMQREPNNIDPMAELVNSYGFTERTQWFMKTCVNKHELGLK